MSSETDPRSPPANGDPLSYRLVTDRSAVTGKDRDPDRLGQSGQLCRL